MVFSSLHFLYIFLPVVMLAHRLAPRRLRNGVLLAASLWFYAWGEPVYVGLMLFSVAWNYVTGLQLGAAARPSRKRAILAGAVAVNLAVLGFFKYYGFLVNTLNEALGLHLPDYNLPLPIGISFYTFQALSYIIDVYRGTTKPQHGLVDFATYITMFPQLVAGPIVKYADIEAQLRKRHASLAQVGQGLERVILGLSKKVLLANNLGLLADSMRAAPRLSVLSAWLGAAAYALQIYFDFSGYSDMAIGMGRMLGFSFAENFDYPYRARSVTGFWRRWHISLSGWFRDYVYIPLGGNRVGVGRHILNLLAVWLRAGEAAPRRLPDADAHTGDGGLGDIQQHRLFRHGALPGLSGGHRGRGLRRRHVPVRPAKQRPVDRLRGAVLRAGASAVAAAADGQAARAGAGAVRRAAGGLHRVSGARQLQSVPVFQVLIHGGAPPALTALFQFLRYPV